MRPGVIIALTASLMLVGWATWYHNVASLGAAPVLTTVAQQEIPQAYYDELTSKFLGTASSTPDKDTAPLTTTDLVGRQLILDYFSLSQGGQATDDNLAALANKYVEDIPAVLSVPTISGFELKVVANDQASFQSYASALENAYRVYASTLLGSSSGNQFTLDSGGAKTFSLMEKVFANTASVMKKIPVPAELAETHLSLVNLYLQDAAAMHALAAFDSDPATSFAGLLAYKTNTDKEADLLSGIEGALAEHGI